jgi:hypothetical protein
VQLPSQLACDGFCPEVNLGIEVIPGGGKWARMTIVKSSKYASENKGFCSRNSESPLNIRICLSETASTSLQVLLQFAKNENME